MTAEDKCWYTLDTAGQPVGPYNIADLLGYASCGWLFESQVFWKEGKSSWDKLPDVLELGSVLKVLKERKPDSAAAGVQLQQPQQPPQTHQSHQQRTPVISAKPSDPLESFKQQIAAVEAGAAADNKPAVADANPTAVADNDRVATPDELEFEDDDGTLYNWDPELRKYIPAGTDPAAAAASAANTEAAGKLQAQQQHDEQHDYDIEAMTYVEEEEVIPTLAGAQAAAGAAAEAADDANISKVRKRSAGAQGGQPGKKGKKAKQQQQEYDNGAAEPGSQAGADEAAADTQGGEEQKGWFQLKVNTSVYVTGLPDDTDVDEVASVFAKCGIIKLDDAGQPKIKLYRDKGSGMLKGDGLVTYLKEPSVALACQILDGAPFRSTGPPMTVTLAQFQMKGNQYQDKKSTGPQQGNKNNKAGKGGGKGKKARGPVSHADKLERKLGWGGFDDLLPPEKVTVVIKGMFTPDEAAAGGSTFVTELEADVLAECVRLGPVDKVRVYANHPDGVVSVKFKKEEPAAACLNLMNGRFFGGQRLVAHMWDGLTNYNVKVPKKESAEEEAARLEVFAKELEQQQAAKDAGAAVSAAGSPAAADGS